MCTVHTAHKRKERGDNRAIILYIKENHFHHYDWPVLWFGQSNFNYKYIICQQKINSIYSNVIICFTSQPLLPYPLNLQKFTTPNESLMSVCCVSMQIWNLFHALNSLPFHLNLQR